MIKCNKCGNKFVNWNTKLVEYDSWGELPMNFCPECDKVGLSYTVYHDDGSVAQITSGGSATALFPAGSRFD